MQLKPDCLVCLYDQALRVTKVLGCEEECAKKVLKESAKIIADLPTDETPPEAAAILYPHIGHVVDKEDLYADVKRRSIEQALRYEEFVRSKIAQSSNPLDAALRAAVVGNVIDFATQVQFDLHQEIQKIFEVPFAIDQKKEFLERLVQAKSLVVIGDNAGEHCFDKIMIEVFRSHFENLSIYYFVRGKPIINDVTMEEAKMIGLDRVCEVVDSGVDTPGFLLERANEQARALYYDADLVLAKGMGNFECMESYQDSRLYFLFKIKCSVVADRVGKNIGDLICAQQGI